MNSLSPDAFAADDLGMTTAPNHYLSTARLGEVAVTDITALLPSRDALGRLAERLPVTVHTSAPLRVNGLLRLDDGWPTAQSTLAAVTTLLARSLRGADYLAKSGPGEFVVVSGPVDASERAAARLVTAIGELGIEGLTAAAGIAPLVPELTAEEVLRLGRSASPPPGARAPARSSGTASPTEPVAPPRPRSARRRR